MEEKVGLRCCFQLLETLRAQVFHHVPALGLLHSYGYRKGVVSAVNHVFWRATIHCLNINGTVALAPVVTEAVFPSGYGNADRPRIFWRAIFGTIIVSFDICYPITSFLAVVNIKHFLGLIGVSPPLEGGMIHISSVGTPLANMYITMALGDIKATPS